MLSRFPKTTLLADPAFLCLLVMIVTYTVVFSYFTIMRMYSLGANAWDLGNYNQALYTFDFNGKLFVWTSDIIANPSGSLFGIHFSPIFFLLALPYFTYPRPETLLVIQSIAIAIGAVPMYWLARDHLTSRRLALLFSLSYLASPALMGVNWFDFHPEAFIPTSLLFVIYFFLTQKWVKLTLSSLFSLTIMGEVGLLVSALGLLFLLRRGFRRPAYLQGGRRVTFAATGLVVAGVVWFAVSSATILIFNPAAPFVRSASPFWSVLGASNVVSVPLAAVTNPVRAFEALSFDAGYKALYVILMLGSFGFLSLRRPSSLLPSLVWLAPAMLSNYAIYYLIGFQYSALVIPFVAYGSIEGAKKLLSAITIKKLTAVLILCVTIGFVVGNPFLSPRFTTPAWFSTGLPNITPRDTVAIGFTKIIPGDASVLADNFIFPLVSSRPNAYTIQASIKYSSVSLLTYIDGLVGKSNYILLDLGRSPLDPTNAVVLSRTGADFGVVGYSHDIILLQRGYKSEPLVFDPIRLVFNYKTLSTQKGTIGQDSSSASGRVLVRTGNETLGSDFWWGPHFLLPPGEYSVTNWLKANPLTNDTLLTLEASVSPLAVRSVIYDQDVGDPHLRLDPEISGPNLLAKNGTTLTGSEFHAGPYQPFSYNVAADTWGLYEFRGLNVQSNATISLDRIEVELLKPFSNVRPIAVRFDGFQAFYYDFSHAGYITRIAQMIPPTGNLLIEGELLPLVVHQGPTFVALPPCCSADNRTLQGELDSKLAVASYVMLDRSINMTTAALVLSRPTVPLNFGILASADGVILLMRGYGGQPQYYVPTSTTSTPV